MKSATDRTRTFTAANNNTGFATICILSPMERVPRHLGDEIGAQPLRIAVTEGSLADAVRPYNKGVHSPGQRYVVRAHFHLLGKLYADRVIDRVSPNIEQMTEEMLNGWVDGEPWMVELAIGHAIVELEFVTFGDEERTAYVASRRGK